MLTAVNDCLVQEIDINNFDSLNNLNISDVKNDDGDGGRHAPLIESVKCYASLDNTKSTIENSNESRVTYNDLIKECTALCNTVQCSQNMSRMVLKTVVEWNKRIQLKQNYRLSFAEVATLEVPKLTP